MIIGADATCWTTNRGAACGTPAIATTKSPLPELLAGGGLFLQPGDESALKEALTSMLREEERRRMGEVARERASRLSWARGAPVALDPLYEAAA